MLSKRCVKEIGMCEGDPCVLFNYMCRLSGNAIVSFMFRGMRFVEGQVYGLVYKAPACRITQLLNCIV